VITRRQFGHACLALWLGVPLAACASGADPLPPDIAYDQDVCDQCGMIISDPRFAAALTMADGRSLKFDDPGEMFEYHRQNPDQAVRAWHAHDYRSGEWIRGEQAFYVFSADLRSPMGYGIAVFAERPAAEAFAHGIGGQVLGFEQAMTASAPDGAWCGPITRSPQGVRVAQAAAVHY
jgi:copper chaperone NosL